MRKLNKHSTARVCLQLTNLFWYLFLTLGVVAPVALLLAYIEKLPEPLNVTISVPINPDTLNFASGASSALSIDAAKANIELATLAREFSNLFFDFALFSILGLGIILGILYHLKNLLDDTVNDAVFTEENIKRIKIIAVLIFIIDPLQWFFTNMLSEPLFADLSHSITVNFPSMGWWFIGLLVYTLAAIFEQGRAMYQELKLTV